MASESKLAGVGGDDADHDEVAAFEELERDFQAVLEGLVGDESMDKFRDEYVKLHEALKRSHENERRLVKRIKELNQEMMSNAAKVASALKISEDDDNTIDALRKQVERAYAMVEAANAKEEAAQNTVEKLQGELDAMHGLVERYTRLLGEDTTLEEVIEARDQFRKRMEEATETARYERERAEDLMSRLNTKKEQLKESKAVTAELRSQIAAKEEEEKRDERRRDRLRAELDKVKDALTRREAEGEKLQKEYEESQASGARVSSELAHVREVVKTTIKQLSEEVTHKKTWQDKAEENERRIVDLQEEVHRQREEVRKAQSELSRTVAEKRRLLGKLSSADGVEVSLRRQIADLRTEAEELRSQLTGKDKDNESSLRALTQAHNQVSRLEHEVRHESERLRTEASRAKDAERHAADVESEVSKKDTKLEIMTRQNEQLRSALISLERHVAQLKEKLEHKQKEKEEVEAVVRLREAQIAEAEKREVAAEARVKQQRQMYDAVRADRNLFSRHLVETQDELAELRRKLKVTERQVDQLKDDVDAKNRSITAIEFDNKATNKRLDEKVREAAQLREALAKARDNVRQLRGVIEELQTTIRKMDGESKEQRRTAGRLVQERDLLGMQLIRRNDEVALLHEKIDIMESTLKKGAAQYGERLEDVRLLKLKVGELRRQLSVANNASSRVDALQREIVRLQKDLMEERTKTKALAEELENPMNVHRWRKLEGSDPATYELVQKVQTLQKRLIVKTQEAVEKEVAIQEKERLYTELKELLARQPGPEMAQRLAAFQKALRERTRQMKAMASELNMSNAQVQEFRYEIQRLEGDLAESRRRHYEQRRRDALAGQRGAARAQAASTAAGASGSTLVPPVPDTAVALAEAQAQRAVAQAPRFVGGGFNTRMGVA